MMPLSPGSALVIALLLALPGCASSPLSQFVAESHSAYEAAYLSGSIPVPASREVRPRPARKTAQAAVAKPQWRERRQCPRQNRSLKTPEASRRAMPPARVVSRNPKSPAPGGSEWKLSARSETAKWSGRCAVSARAADLSDRALAPLRPVEAQRPAGRLSGDRRLCVADACA